MVQLTTQLAVYLENKPGTLARLCDILQEAEVNVYAISTGDTVDYCVVRLVVSDPHRAAKVIEDHGAVVVETPVLLVEADNKPGMLGRIAHKLAGAGVNLDYAYAATSPTTRRGLIVLRSSNPRKAMRALNL
jgi:hypothetical protein